MKIKKVIGICKKNRVFNIFQNEVGEQWLSDGCAFYQVLDLPPLNADWICNLYDINDNQRDKMQINVFYQKPPIDVEDKCENESETEIWKLRIGRDDTILMPISTELGLMFLDTKYLTPFSDMPRNNMTLTLRKSRAGVPYFAVKFGLFAYGFIAAYDIKDEDFTEELKNLYAGWLMLLNNKETDIDETV